MMSMPTSELTLAPAECGGSCPGVGGARSPHPPHLARRSLRSLREAGPRGTRGSRTPRSPVPPAPSMLCESSLCEFGGRDRHYRDGADSQRAREASAALPRSRVYGVGADVLPHEHLASLRAMGCEGSRLEG